MKKKFLLIIWLTFLLTGIMAFFWYNDWVYSLPTPVPQTYKPVYPGQQIALPAGLHRQNTKPLFLHFFNPDCPCSRFNVAHFKSLVKEYGSRANFAIVVLSSKKYAVGDIQDRFDTTIPVYSDSAIAAACGVYSTPQAVIIDNSNALYYRGNYNRSRYCTDKKTEYARAALDAILLQHPLFYDPYAVKTYGCSLPKCTN